MPELNRDPKKLLNQSEFCEQTGVAPATAEKWRWLGKGPCFVKIGRLVKYRQSDIDEWIEANMRGAQC